MIGLPPFAEAQIAPLEEEELSPFEGTSLQFLQSIYRDRRLPLAVRRQAAQVAIAYEHPKLSASANFSVGGRMESLMSQHGGSTIIDGRVERSVASPEGAVRSGPVVEPAEGTSREP
jgi:hypothetical protein